MQQDIEENYDFIYNPQKRIYGSWRKHEEYKPIIERSTMKKPCKKKGKMGSRKMGK